MKADKRNSITKSVFAKLAGKILLVAAVSVLASSYASAQPIFSDNFNLESVNGSEIRAKD